MKQLTCFLLAALPLAAGCASTILVGPPDHVRTAQRITTPPIRAGEPVFCIASFDGTSVEVHYNYLAQRGFRDLRLLTREHHEGEACGVLL